MILLEPAFEIGRPMLFEGGLVAYDFGLAFDRDEYAGRAALLALIYAIEIT